MLILSMLWINIALVLPLVYMLVQVGTQFTWSWEILSACRLSLLCSTVTMMINGGMGLLAAWGFTHGHWPAKSIWLGILNLPLSISPVIVALMLNSVYGIHSPIGKWLWTKHLVIPFHFSALVLASLFVTLPFVVKEIVPILEQLDETQKEAARILGAKETQVFWKISFPYVRRALINGVIATHCRAMGEFGAVALLSGNISHQTQTLTLLLEQSYKEYETPLAWSVALLLSIWCFCLKIAHE
nr:sulfate transport protein [Cyanidioschyzonaceae sp. 3]WDB00390.1 sulfate transport system permease protein [Cyanidiococcus yangmingshanensis]